MCPLSTFFCLKRTLFTTILSNRYCIVLHKQEGRKRYNYTRTESSGLCRPSKTDWNSLSCRSFSFICTLSSRSASLYTVSFRRSTSTVRRRSFFLDPSSRNRCNSLFARLLVLLTHQLIAMPTAFNRLRLCLCHADTQGHPS